MCSVNTVGLDWNHFLETETLLREILKGHCGHCMYVHDVLFFFSYFGCKVGRMIVGVGAPPCIKYKQCN